MTSSSSPSPPAPSPSSGPGKGSLVERVLEPSAPRPLKLAAARGALPLSPQDRVLALVMLSGEADAEIAGEAGRSLGDLPGEALRAILAEPQTNPAVLDHFARREGMGDDLLGLIVIHPATSEEALLHLAALPRAGILDKIVGNEARLARNPAIAGVLKSNPALSRESHRRILELEQHLLGHEEISFRPAAAPVEEPPPVEEEPPPPEAPEEAEASNAPFIEIPLTPEEQAAEEALKSTPLFQRISLMTVAEKVQAAMKGNAEARSILIRDPARVVAVTVLKSPKLGDQEIEGFAKLRNVNDEVLRIIGTHRDWTKNYGVALALARNPRTPTGISLTMLNRMVNKDLKNLGSDKNIPEVIRRSAKRLFDLRTKPPEKKGRRK